LFCGIPLGGLTFVIAGIWVGVMRMVAARIGEDHAASTGCE
jgi:hypothetical protein